MFFGNIRLKINHIRELERILERLSIKKEDICIVGSSVLAVYNIRHNKDIDIIIAPKIRREILEGSSAHNLTENVECVASGWFNRVDRMISDEELVYNPRYHFTYGKFKYCNLDILRRRKAVSEKTKDRKDVEHINDKSKY